MIFQKKMAFCANEFDYRRVFYWNQNKMQGNSIPMKHLQPRTTSFLSLPDNISENP
jgi:hypothetical protein